MRELSKKPCCGICPLFVFPGETAHSRQRPLRRQPAQPGLPIEEKRGEEKRRKEKRINRLPAAPLAATGTTRDDWYQYKRIEDKRVKEKRIKEKRIE